MNVAALAYGVLAMVLLAWPGNTGVVATDWTVLIGLAVVAGSGLLYLLAAKPDRRSTAPSGDAIEVARKLRAGRPAADQADGPAETPAAHH